MALLVGAGIQTAENQRQAHVCVSTTARAGAELGYDVLLVADAIGDRDIPGASGKDVTKVSSSHRVQE